MSGLALWSIREAAALMGMRRRAATRWLKARHAQYGGLLFRAEGGRNTKLWVDHNALTRLLPAIARHGEPGEILTRLATLEEEVRSLAEYRRKATPRTPKCVQSGPRFGQK